MSTPSSPDPDPQVRNVELLHHFHEFEHNFQRDHFPLWLATLIGPWLTSFALAGLVWGLCGPEYTRSLLAAATVAFVFAGRFVILMEGLGNWAKLLTPEQLFWMVTYLDVAVALFMAFHVGFLFKLPRIGPKIAELTIDGELILALHPWMKQLTFWGLVAFISFPLAATGSVGGALFGRLLGLSRWATFWGSVIGAAIGNAAMLYGSKLIVKYLPSNSPVVQWGGPVIIVLLIVLLERRYKSMKQQFLQERALGNERNADG